MYADPLQLGAPDWSGQARQRLLLSLAMSASCIATLVLVMQFPVVDQAKPLTELLVRILVEEVESVMQPSADDVSSDAPASVPRPASQADTGIVSDDAVSAKDWYAEIPATVAEALNKVPREYSANPSFDEKRRRAALQFAPSEAPREVPVWENVEKDTLGRSVLWSGDCYRVIDDPNVGSREAFEIFGQYMISCVKRKYSPQELPWVKEIRSRRANQARYGHQAAE